ncbi:MULTISPECIES: ATP-binding protein [Pseudomonas]|uniref:ATP-binding protein n=1 Tax=Pseudomonas TaxID=286 RepID=UPI001BCDB108|nr:MULTISPECIES: ATP-binding protein [Pseudomonas]MBS7600494.1 ATP-binding protein [Pseudomonas sp. RC2C2]UVL26253.1 ATP-binding protein [Pseudomonas donghuensis]
MKFVYCSFRGLKGFDHLELEGLDALTVLTGPNGVGKSTVLRVLKFAFEILERGTISDVVPKHDSWDCFSEAILHFRNEKLRRFEGESVVARLEVGDLVQVKIKCDGNKFTITELCVGTSTWWFSEESPTKTIVTDLKIKLNKNLEMHRKVSEEAQHPSVTQGHRQQLVSDRNALSEIIKEQEEQFSEYGFLINEDPFGSKEPVGRVLIDGLFTALGFPVAEYVDARQLYQDAIPELLDKLLEQKKGRKHDNEKYWESVGRLGHLLQSDVDVSLVGDTKAIHINGVSHENASSGTKISLAFFSLTRLGQPNCIILWDEPENGLHPTRRVRLLDLMFADGRQFVLATHAPEFAPVFSASGKVFRCFANYDYNSTNIHLGVEPVANRRDAFMALEALGVHPASTLFTANVVIWVEGPTELFFYRHWLVPRLTEKKLIEGFHYTFMQYGGALISYLSVADEAQFGSTFDLLSMCRHPVIIVDSDLRSAPDDADPATFLKVGAQRIKKEIDELNDGRSKAGLFLWTAGREVENFLPVSAIWAAVSSLWSGYEKHQVALQKKTLEFDQYASYHEALWDHFLATGVAEIDKKNPAKALPIGRSVWGGANKVEMMRAALNAEGLCEADLMWDCSATLDDIQDFILSKCPID